MKIVISHTPFNAYQLLDQYQANELKNPEKSGANAIFIGTMRDFNENHTIRSMFLEHYPEMTQIFLEKLVQENTKIHQLNDVLVVHRVGEILPNQHIVLVSVWSAHRKQAFTACRSIMEQLKSKAPFWKKESLADGRQKWVSKNTEG